MKTSNTRRICAAYLAIAVCAYAQIRPAYVPGRLLFVLDEDTTMSTPSGRTPTDLFEAIDATEVRILAPRTYVVSLPAGARIGRAFSTAQSFDFGVGSRWSLRAVDEDGIPPIDVGFGPPRTDFLSRVFTFAVRADVRSGEGVTIGGLVVPDGFAHLVVMKVRGPSLSGFGVERVLANPLIQLFDGAQPILQNDDWSSLRDFEKQRARAVCAPPADPREPMLITLLDPGVAYSAVVSGASGDTGVAMLEVFVIDTFYTGPNARMVAASADGKKPNKAPEPTP